jgi:phosphoglycerol transferase MdoB-like AlkP superfamily enzyme
MPMNDQDSRNIPLSRAVDSRRRMILAAIPAVLTVVLDMFWRGQSGFMEYSVLMFLLDFVIVFCVALVILNLQKRQILAMTVLTGMAAYLYAAAWVKYDTLGQTPRYSDLALLREFFYFYGPWVSAALAAPFVILIGLLAWNFRMNVGMLGMVVAPMIALFFLSPHAIAAFQLDRQEGSGHHYFPLPLLVGQYAAFLHSAVNYKVREQRLSELSKHAGAEIKNADLFIDRSLGTARPRNIHVILIESLVDPAHINGFTFSSDPVAAPFRDWMNRSGSRAYSPVAGNRSPDAEFEILCGLSTALDLGQVVFSNLPIRGVDCLPAKLRQQGWLTLATNSVHPHQFNKTNAYAGLGFRRAYFRTDFPLGDLDGPNPTDAVVLKKNLEIIADQMKAGQPVFNFILTTSTHFPFFRDETRRPDVVTVSPKDDLVRRYVNGVRYATDNAAAP